MPLQADLNDDLYVRYRDLLLARCGLDYPEQKRIDLAHGLNLALGATQHQSLAELYDDALAGGAAWEAIVAQLTIGETYFFRNSAQFDALREQIVPELLGRRATTRTLRIWSAGCATGEEPYSLAILLSELLPNVPPWSVSILATDLNQAFLARAREALYGNWSFRETPNALRDRFWTEEQGRWRLISAIRRMVTFAHLNLAEPCYPLIVNGTSALDLIVCRNVTIYFDAATTRQVAQRFYDALTPGGWLIVGHAEPQASVYHQFEVHNFPNTVIYRKPLDAPIFSAAPNGQPLNASAHRAAKPTAQLAPIFAETQLDHGSVEPPRAPMPASERRSICAGAQELRLASSALEPATPSQADQWLTIVQLLEQGDLVGAESLLNSLLAAHPSHEAARLALGRLYADRANWVAARQHCMLILEQNPLSVAAQYLLGQIHEHQGQINAALAAYRRTVFLDPQFVPGMLGMASAWRQLGRYPEAQRAARNAVRYLSGMPATAIVTGYHGALAGELLTLAEQQLADIVRLK